MRTGLGLGYKRGGNQFNGNLLLQMKKVLLIPACVQQLALANSHLNKEPKQGLCHAYLVSWASLQTKSYTLLVVDPPPLPIPSISFSSSLNQIAINETPTPRFAHLSLYLSLAFPFAAWEIGSLVLVGLFRWPPTFRPGVRWGVTSRELVTAQG